MVLHEVQSLLFKLLGLPLLLLKQRSVRLKHGQHPHQEQLLQRLIQRSVRLKQEQQVLQNQLLQRKKQKVLQIRIQMVFMK